MTKFLFCFGTRPEAIKMAPVVKEVRAQGHKAIICLTGQHKDMIKPFMKFFDLDADFDLDIMKPNQSLSLITASILSKMEEVISLSKPDVVMVQGDTTSTFACALSAFYHKIPVAHIEAGLRTGDIYSPFPEECNRKLVSAFANYFYPPTELSKSNLALENIVNNVLVTGNTGIDTLRLTIDQIRNFDVESSLLNKYKFIDFSKKIILTTIHRRENHGLPLEHICNAIANIAKHDDVEFVIPVHLNPNVQKFIHEKFSNINNVHLLQPLDYVDFTWFMYKSFIIISDSGGVQEEGPFFKKPILILRESTERQEGVLAQVSKLVGSNCDLITNEANKLLSDSNYYQSFLKNDNPFGDGHASKLIVRDLLIKLN